MYVRTTLVNETVTNNIVGVQKYLRRVLVIRFGDDLVRGFEPPTNCGESKLFGIIGTSCTDETELTNGGQVWCQQPR